MRSIKFGLGLLFVTGLGVTVACGGSSSDTAGSSGTGSSTAGAAGSGVAGSGVAGSGIAGSGTSGAAGSGVAGAAGSGTAGAGTSGAAGAGTSGAAGAGTSGAAGAGTAGAAGAGTAGAAGAGGNPASCPATAPTAGDMCTPPMGGGFNTVCHYSTEACNCPGFGANANKWACLDCPATEPMTGDMCTAPAGGGIAGGLDCAFANGDTCTCNGFGGMPTWTCMMPPPPTLMCPMTAPMTGDTCNAVGNCTFNGGGGGMATRCVCTGGKFTCGMPGDPGAQCTAAMGMQLATGDMCTNVGRCGGGGGGRTCVCDGKTVTCN